MSQPPPNQYRIEKEFWDFIQSPENRGFNARFAEHRGDADASYVSRMHSPFVPEVKSWLYETALEIHRAFEANPRVGEFALRILGAVGAAYRPAGDLRLTDVRRAQSDFDAVSADFEDGLATPEELELAAERLAVTLGRLRVRRERGVEIAG